jgi:hypothetical protein
VLLAVLVAQEEEQVAAPVELFELIGLQIDVRISSSLSRGVSVFMVAVLILVA